MRMSESNDPKKSTAVGGDESRDAVGPLWLLILFVLLSPLAKVAAIGFGASSYLFQSAYKPFQLFAPVVWRRKIDRRTLLCSFWPFDEPLPSTATWLIAVGTAAALAGSAIATVLLLAGPLGIEPAQLREQFDQKFDMTSAKAVAVVFYLFTINAALEELHFRAWFDRELASRFGDTVGIGVSAIVFSAMHLFIFAGMDGVTPSMMVLLFVALAIAGVAWSLIARRPGGIHAAWLSHGLTDAGLLTWGLFWLGYFSALSG